MASNHGKKLPHETGNEDKCCAKSKKKHPKLASQEFFMKYTENHLVPQRKAKDPNFGMLKALTKQYSTNVVPACWWGGGGWSSYKHQLNINLC